MGAPDNLYSEAMYILAGTSPERIKDWSNKFRKVNHSTQDIILESLQGPTALFGRNGIRGTINKELW